MRLAATVALICGLIVLCAGLTYAQRPALSPKYVGSETCVGCHKAAADQWSKSHHALAWKEPDEKTVKANFDNATFDHKELRTLFSRRGKRYMIQTKDQNGKSRQFEVKGVAGIEPLQQYILETEPGRLQSFDLAWDTVRKRWYNLYPDQRYATGDGLHWTGPYKSWNARCAECHATGYKKSYDAKTRRYHSTQAEISVGCEACHGPGQAHLKWAANPDGFDAKAWKGLSEKGFTIAFKPEAAETEIQQCAGCHSRREPLTDGNPLPGSKFHDYYRLSLLRPGLYHADGSIQDEVYVLGSFLQSKMNARGVRCSDCHNPHSGQLKADGNAICTQCHSPAGNTRFPTLRKANYDTSSHHFHEAGSEGAQCKSCHMIERTYMGVDGRRDHSFRIPRPDLSTETGAPNACTDCHKDKGAGWAAAELTKRFPDSTHRGAHYSQTFAKARRDPRSQVDQLIAIAQDKSQAPIVRATAIDLLRGAASPDIANRTATLIADKSPLVRSAALAAQRGAPPTESVPRILPALEDPIRSVRIAAVMGILGARIARLPARSMQALRKANAEWRSSLLAKADFPESHLVLGGIALTMRNLRAAQGAFEEAVRQDPQLIRAWTMLVRIAAARRDLAGAQSTLNRALAANPNDPTLGSMQTQLGNIRRRQ